MNYKTKRILKYLVKNMGEEIPVETVKKKFNLSKMDFVKLFRPLYNKDIVVLTKDEKVCATKYSKYYLNDFRINSFYKVLWSFVVPIIVSIITTLITIGLTKLFE